MVRVSQQEKRASQKRVMTGSLIKGERLRRKG
jgi:hypothetical protein